MNKLGEVMLEVSEDWFADLPAPEEVPAYTYSKKYLKWEQEIIYGKKHVTLKRVAKVLLIAAILIIMLAVIALSTTKGREFILHFFNDSAVYSVDMEMSKEVTELNVSYLPDRFRLENTFIEEGIIMYHYSYQDEWIQIRKHFINTSADFHFDSSLYDSVDNNGITYLISASKNGFCNIVWNYNDYFYQVNGNVEKNELLKVAYNIQ